MNGSMRPVALSPLTERQGRGLRRSPWHRWFALAGLALFTRSMPVCTGLEVIESVVDRDGEVLVVEDILEGFGEVPVSVVFSPTTSHMFIGFKSGQVRIYPDGGDTLVAAVFDSCVDIEDDVSEIYLGTAVVVLQQGTAVVVGSNALSDLAVCDDVVCHPRISSGVNIYRIFLYR